MGLVVSRLRLCPVCGRTAVIIHSDGTVSSPFVTREQALEAVDGMERDGVIDEHEAMMLRLQIRKSALASGGMQPSIVPVLCALVRRCEASRYN
jgi:hypothetical protein